MNLLVFFRDKVRFSLSAELKISSIIVSAAEASSSSINGFCFLVLEVATILTAEALGGLFFLVLEIAIENILYIYYIYNNC